MTYICVAIEFITLYCFLALMFTFFSIYLSLSLSDIDNNYNITRFLLFFHIHHSQVY